MKIDLEKAKKVFNEYVEKFDIKNEKIRLKVEHTFKVAENSRKISRKLNLTDEQQDLAELIGLLHDIGRFEQVKRYNTFMDSQSIDHSVQGIEVLFENKLIRQFLETEEYDEIIKKAILNHNKPQIEEGLDAETNLQAKIIRDSDKLDIFRVILEFNPKDTMVFTDGDIVNEKISDDIYNQYMNKELINYKNLKTNVDVVITWFAYTYDLYFKESREEVIANKYIDKISTIVKFKNEDTINKIKAAAEKAKEYLEN